jgi:hypothetical protein
MKRWWLLGFVALTVVSAVGARAQVVAVELSYSNPGARSMGLGGAFAALADDATASFANPSGLVQLTRPEVSAEGRSWSYSTSFTSGGRAEGAPSGIGIDTDPDLRFGVSEDDLKGLSFLSFVYPKGNWSFSVYRHLLANFALTSQVQGLFTDEPGVGGVHPGFAGVVRDQDTVTELELEIITYGLAVGYRVSDSLSLGFGLTYFTNSGISDSREYRPNDDTMASYFALNSYLPERVEQQSNGIISGSDLGLNAGLLWNIDRRWRLGAFYRAGPNLDLREEISPGPAGGTYPPFTVSSNAALPDVYGLGIAFRSHKGNLTAAFEWDRVEYSSLIESLMPDVAPPEMIIEDGDELHLGAEYAILDLEPVVALRIGTWLDPDHRLQFQGDEAFAEALFLPGEDEIHWALGLGLAFNRFQLDLGADFSDPVDTVSISAIYSF